MGKLKKIGIGFGIIVGLFFALVIAVGIAGEIEKANMTPEELRQWEEEREARALQKEIDEKRAQEKQEAWEIQKALQDKQALEEYEARSIEEAIPQVNMEDEVKSVSLREKYDNAVGWDAEDEVIRDWLSSYTGSGKAELTFTKAINYLLVITYTEEERNHPEASIWIEYLENTDIPWNKGFEYSGRYVDVILHVKAGYDDDVFRWLIDLDEEILYGTDEGSNEILSLLDIE